MSVSNSSNLPANSPSVLDEAGDIAAWAGQAGDETLAHRVGDKNKYDRDLPRFSLKRSGDWCRVREDGIGSRADQLFRKNLHPINVAVRPTIVDPHVATVRPTQLLKPRP